MPQRRDPVKPHGKSSKIPKAGGSPRPPSDPRNEGREDDSYDRGELSVTQSSALEKILARFDVIDSEMKAITLKVDEGIKAQEFNTQQIEDKLKEHISDCQETRREVDSIGKEADGLRARVNFQGFRLTDVERRIEQLEREKRRNIMIIEGVLEKEGVFSPGIVDELFVDLKLDFDSLVCERIHRRGKAPPGPSGFAADHTGSNDRAPKHKVNTRPRPIVVGFLKSADKSKVFRNLSNLKGNDKWKGVYFNDDYTECQKNQIRDLRALAAFARKVGREATVRNHYLWVNGKRYTFEEIGKLAPEITLEKAKTLEVLGGEGLAFQSIHSPLSNLYPCNVSHRNERFLSSEAAIHHTRAILSKRRLEAQQILQTRDPYRVKDIGASFKASDEWEQTEDAEYDSILEDKFTRNHYCRDFLIATGNKKLFEATGDRKWACGIPLSKIDTLTATPPGENRMGKKLERVREKIKKSAQSK